MQLGKRQRDASVDSSASEPSVKRAKISVSRSDQIKDNAKLSSDQKINSGLSTTHSSKNLEEKKSAKKSDEEEKKGVEPTRKSERNMGRELNYNIDAILAAADDIENGNIGGGSISVMLAKTYDPE